MSTDTRHRVKEAERKTHKHWDKVWKFAFIAIASNLIAIASNLIPMASNLLAMPWPQVFTF